VYISCSTLHKAQIVFYLARASGVTLTGSEWQYCPHRKIDVCGPVDTEFFLPEVSQGYCRTSTDNEWALYVQCLSFSAPLASATPVYITSYQSAAEDVTYYGLRDYQISFTPQSNPRLDFKNKFQPLQEGFGHYVQHGILTDNYTSMIEIVKSKVCMFEKTAAVDTTMPTVPVWAAANTVNGLNMWVQFFQFWKGSTVFRFNTLNVNEKAMLTIKDRNGYYMPYADIMIPNTATVSELKLPFNSPVSMVSTRLDNEFTDNELPRFIMGAFGTGYIWVSAGDDFRMSHLMYPPWTVTLAPTTATTYGISGAMHSY